MAINRTTKKAIRIATIRTQVWNCKTYRELLEVLMANTDLDKDLDFLAKAGIAASLDSLFNVLKLKENE
jgi:hypothetical protein